MYSVRRNHFHQKHLIGFDPDKIELPALAGISGGEELSLDRQKQACEIGMRHLQNNCMPSANRQKKETVVQGVSSNRIPWT